MRQERNYIKMCTEGLFKAFMLPFATAVFFDVHIKVDQSKLAQLDQMPNNHTKTLNR